MLVLSRKVGERLVIGNDVVVQVVAIQGNRIRLGIEAPVGVGIWREEVISVPHVVPTGADGSETPVPGSKRLLPKKG